MKQNFFKKENCDVNNQSNEGIVISFEIFYFVCVCIWVQVPVGQKWALDPQELELWAVVSYPVWMLGAQLLSPL